MQVILNSTVSDTEVMSELLSCVLNWIQSLYTCSIAMMSCAFYKNRGIAHYSPDL